MPHEQLSTSPERNEASAELEAARAERLAEMRENSPEHDPADLAAKRAEHARHTIEKQAEEPEPDQAEAAPAPKARPHAILDHHLNYTQTMASVQRKLGPASRRFSKIIHTPIIEKTSEALEQTVARPSLLMGATWTAVIVGATFYFTARHYGYALSGSEMLFSLIVGGLLGLVIEGVWHNLKRRR